ncbi:myc box-dependent-interacting protein 1b isoform X3 [Pygocentrus nattereri]|uniref:myc box-dependent-interacting protein 1b isoform X3 n=1 Tax=Pygocentrus nattereri TaxID=42514 RepID=UPI0008144F68|nr:myc box-dependent-interacting protein 1b isoform X3 [Pygocentrus nattereri]
MAETGKGVNAGKLASNVQKRITRAQEKMMQKLGKADETKDTAFEESVANFNKQMTEGTKLQRDLRAYLAAVKTMHESSKRLQDCLAEMYEPDWFGKEEMDALAEDTDVLWGDFYQKLVDSALISMDTYMAQFPEIKARIAKRERKLVDFDSARHHFASIQKSKKKDEAKIAKPLALMEKAAPGWAQGIITAHQIAQTNLSRSQAEEELGKAQKVFEEISYDLQEELPTLWSSRVGLYVTTFQNVAGMEEKFHREMGKLNQNLFDIMTKLEEQREAKKSVNTTGKSEAAANHNATAASESDTTVPASKLRLGPPVPRPPRPSPAKDAKTDIINLFEDAVVPDINVTTPSKFDAPTVGNLLDMDLDAMEAVSAPRDPQAASWDSWEPQPEQTSAASKQQDLDEEAQPGWDAEDYSSKKTCKTPSWDDEGTPAAQAWEDHRAAAETEACQPSWEDEEEASWGEEGAQTDTSATTPPNAATTVTNGSSDAEVPSGVAYKVKAMHDYAATDSDELDLKAGDIVLVLPFDNPDEQDDGWLLGVKESHWLLNKDLTAKGVFPENFTQRL